MNYIKSSEEEVLNWLQNNLSEERYTHTLGTAQCAKKLAKQFGLNEEKAYYAGLLHDCAKCFSTEELLEIINNHLEVDECQMLNYKTLHAPVSAFIAETKFGVEDGEILNSIARHTLGHLQMSEFDKIVFIADKIETNTRKIEDSKEIQAILDEKDGINKALLQLYKKTIKSLVKRDLKICLLTIEIYNQLEDLIKI
ncbi:MAG: bis(5'-nucleosyl)-tetraphosphatase (symmetrical) YqeK [Candidatus Gastranaerophilales bacterium]